MYTREKGRNFWILLIRRGRESVCVLDRLSHSSKHSIMSVLQREEEEEENEVGRDRENTCTCAHIQNSSLRNKREEEEEEEEVSLLFCVSNTISFLCGVHSLLFQHRVGRKNVRKRGERKARNDPISSHLASTSSPLHDPFVSSSPSSSPYNATHSFSHSTPRLSTYTPPPPPPFSSFSNPHFFV